MRRAFNASNEFPLLTKGNGQEGAPAAEESILGKSFCSRTSGMWSVPCSRIQRTCGIINTDLGAANGYGTKMSPRNQTVPLVESQHHVIDPTNPGGALDDGVEHRLHVGGRAADDAEHLGRCRLMLQRLAQFRVALAEFLEQAHVLDGDHRLVGEGFEKRYLFVGEGTNLCTADDDQTDGDALAK